LAKCRKNKRARFVLIVNQEIFLKKVLEKLNNFSEQNWQIEKIKAGLIELPLEKKKRFKAEYNFDV